MASIKSSAKTPRRIALVDCNNFYASCERVFRPDWQHRPIGVLSNNDGCIIARSNELKEAGIPMGAPYFKYREQLQQIGAVVVSSNYALYGDMSHRVMSTLGQFTPEFEIYSIDEAWLDFTGFACDTLDSYAREIVSTTFRHTGIPVSMGIGSTKVLAKLANRICKKRNIPGQVFNLGDAAAMDAILDSVEVGDIWGIGRRWAENLNRDGIYTALHLANACPERIRSRYNVVMQRIVLELCGIPCLEQEDIEPKKQIIASRSFGERVTTKEALAEALSMHASRAGEKLRSQGSACGMIQISIRTGRHNPEAPYYSNSANIVFDVATSDTRKLVKAAHMGLNTIYRLGYRYAKAGIMLRDIMPANQVQGTLFSVMDNDASITLMHTMDMLNKRYGKRTIFLASENTRQSWAMKRGFRSPSYTTSWAELPVAH